MSSLTSDLKSDDQILCYPCYKFFNQMLKSDACMLPSEDILAELKAKKQNLERIVHEFEYITLEPSDIVELSLQDGFACMRVGSI